MIRFLFILLFGVCMATGRVVASAAYFFIQTEALGDEGGKTASGYLSYFETEVTNNLKDNFPCAKIASSSNVAVLISHERDLALLGNGSESALENIGRSLGCQYLVHLKVELKNQTVLIKATCIDDKKAKTMAIASEAAQHGDAALDAIERTAKKLIDELKDYEICPFTGPVNIEVKSTRDEKTTENMAAPCGDSADNVVIATTRTSNETTKWALTKDNLRGSSGTVNYDLHEKTIIVSKYSCYKCEGSQGEATITEAKENETKIEGLSNESVSEGQKVDDARIKLIFFDDGTYNLLVKATSKHGTKKETTEKKVSGVCENEGEPRKTKTSEVNIPVDIVFGPYPGTTKDKVLQQKETKDISEGNEKSTLTIDFTLTRN
jgi:hypothetical protein